MCLLDELIEKLYRICEVLKCDRLVDVESAHISGISSMTVGEAGLHFLKQLAETNLKVKVFSTCNPACVPLDKLNREEDYVQWGIIQALRRLGVSLWATCTPYEYMRIRSGRYYAWSESSAVAFINSVYDAYAEKFPGVLALLSAIVGKAPKLGTMSPSNRTPRILVKLSVSRPLTYVECGILGKLIAETFKDNVVYLSCPSYTFPTLEHVKSFLASYATYSNNTLVVIEGLTRNYMRYKRTLTYWITDKLDIALNDIEKIVKDLDVVTEDYLRRMSTEKYCIVIGCPHIGKIALKRILDLAYQNERKFFRGNVFIFTSRFALESLKLGRVNIIVDTCLFVSRYLRELSEQYDIIFTNSVKQYFYLCRKLGDERAGLVNLTCIDKAMVQEP